MCTIVLIIVTIVIFPGFKIEALRKPVLQNCTKCPPCVCCMEYKTAYNKISQNNTVVKRIKTNRTDYVNYVDLSKCFCPICRCPNNKQCKLLGIMDGFKKSNSTIICTVLAASEEKRNQLSFLANLTTSASPNSE